MKIDILINLYKRLKISLEVEKVLTKLSVQYKISIGLYPNDERLKYNPHANVYNCHLIVLRLKFANPFSFAKESSDISQNEDGKSAIRG